MNREIKIGGYHIHSDAFVPPTEEFVREAEQLGFMDTSFTQTVEGLDMFVPVGKHTMFSYFTDDKRDFNEKWRAFVDVGTRNNFVGYMEGEYAEPYALIEEKPFDPEIPFPFNILRRKVEGGAREPFRETEFHLEFDFEASDKRLVEKLLSCGLYGALYPEPEGYRSLTLTIQGTNREIMPLQEILTEYLRQAGGLVRGKIAKEDVREHAEFGITPEAFPEVVDTIQYAPL